MEGAGKRLPRCKLLNRTWLAATAHGWAGSEAFLRSGNTDLTDLAEHLPAEDTQRPRPGAVQYAEDSDRPKYGGKEEDPVDECAHDRY